MKKILFLILLIMIVLIHQGEVVSFTASQGKEIDLVLSGSGTRHPAYVGAIRALLENGYQIKRVAGVSGGGLVACALSDGIINAQDPPEAILKRISFKVDKGKKGFIERWKRFYNLIKQLGFYSGDEFEDFLDKVFAGKMMSDLKIPTKIYGTDIWNQKVVVFTNNDHLKISRALRMTTSVPILFTPVKFNGGLIVDGGIGGSFPIDAFKDGARPIIGMRLKAPETLPKNVTSPDELSLFQYIKLILLTIFTSLEKEHMQQVPPPGAQIIALDIGDFSRIDPDINEKERIDMYQSGYFQMKKRMKEIDTYVKDFPSRRDEK
jgi:NTE family protein